MSRSISDYLLHQGNTSKLVLVSISTELKKQQQQYCEQLHTAQTTSLDCTVWIVWYLQRIRDALHEVLQTIEEILQIKQLYRTVEQLSLNERQQGMVRRLTTDFYGALTAQKWARLNTCSHDTAIRDSKDFIRKGILKRSEAGGRRASYLLMLEDEQMPT